MRRRIYISGPLTSSGNELENVQAAILACRRLIAAGFAPMVPHLFHYVDPGGEVPHATWMEVDLPWVEVADAVLRLPGESAGADIEEEHARLGGIPVFQSITTLEQCLRPEAPEGSEHLLGMA